MAKQPAAKNKEKSASEKKYVHNGSKRSKQPEGYAEAALSGRMADYAIKQILKEYTVNPWDGNDLSEDYVAEDIIKYCGRYIRYTENGWMGWSSEDGSWKGEEYAESMVQWIVRHYGRLLAENATEEYYEGVRFARHLLSSSGINAVMSIIKRDKRIVATRDQFDAEPEVLNCKGDLYNLRTEEIRPCEPEDYITKSTLCKPADNDSNKSPLPQRFIEFMEKITSKDEQRRPDLSTWILSYFGYSLTGETGASFFVNFHGSGQNGKSVLLKLMMAIFGDYAAAIPQDIVIENRFASQFLLAGLHGIRLGVLADAGEGQLNMKVLKELTTGEPMNAPVKFKKDTTLKGVCKLAVGTNYRLKLKNTGKDIRRRVRMIPFDYTVPDDEVVPNLQKLLLEEAPHILRVLIFFAREYYRRGQGAKAFPKCEIIDEASEEYLKSQDLVGRWVQDNTEVTPGYQENVDDMYKNFQAWCLGEGVKKVMGKSTFGEHLSFHVKKKKHTNKGTAYLDIKLIGSSPPLAGSG